MRDQVQADWDEYTKWRQGKSRLLIYGYVLMGLSFAMSFVRSASNVGSDSATSGFSVLFLVGAYLVLRGKGRSPWFVLLPICAPFLRDENVRWVPPMPGTPDVEERKNRQIFSS